MKIDNEFAYFLNIYACNDIPLFSSCYTRIGLF